MASADCLFCRIVRGEIPSDQVASTEGTYAFRDIDPVAPTHVLVVPRRHYATCFELDDALAGPLFGTALRIARAVDRLHRPDGLSLVQNNRPAAGQSVFHVHLHVLPRTQGVRVNLHDPKGLSDRAELDRMAAEIAAALGEEG